MVLERWTQDRSFLHVRILRSAPQAQLPVLGDLPVLPTLPLPGGGAGMPPALQAMLGVAAEAAAAEALNSDTTLPPLPTLSLLPNLQPLPQQEQPQQQQQQQPPEAAGSPAPAAATGCAPSAATSSRMGASGGNSTSNLSEPTPPSTAAEADVPMQRPASDTAAGS